MTLLLALGNVDFVTVVADRRLTMNGVLCDDEANKLCFLCCEDARAVIAFTGLAEAGTFSTQDWLLNTLGVIDQTTHTFMETLLQLKEHATRDISAVVTPDRRLTFAIAGFVFGAEQPAVVCHYLSNFENELGIARPDFELRTLNPGADGVLVEALGATSGLKASDTKMLREMLLGKKRAPDVVRKAVHAIQAGASNPMSQGLVGKQCNSAVVPCQPNTTLVSTYHSAFPSNVAYGANAALSFSTRSCFFTGYELFSEAFIAGPAIRNRDPCWCGSGTVSKHCHLKRMGSVRARVAGFKRPLAMLAEAVITPGVQSGSRFCVSSAFE